MLDGFFELISGLLNFYYELVPNYVVAIAMLTLTVMVITTPLTMKSTRSMVEMQRLQPEIKKLQQQYKDDRQKLNEEMMRFYKEHQINPLGGCLPILVQAPVFSLLFWVVRGLINKANFEGLQEELADRGVMNADDIVRRDGFKPKYLHLDSDLYQSLLGKTEMKSFGIDLAISPAQALQEGFLTALPYVSMVLIIGGLSWYQSKQIAGRQKSSEMAPQQKMMMRIGPAMFVFIAFSMPAALGVYFVVSTIWRVGQQTYITHTLYKGEDSVGVQAQKAMAEARADREKQKTQGNGAKKSSAKAPSGGKAGTKTGNKTSSGAKAGNKAGGNGATSKSSIQDSTGAAATGAGGSAKPQQHPRSKKKKKRK
jgi:YidC/Oxa1 family membrane protein insertase